MIHRGAEAMRRVIYRAVALSKSERFYIYQGSNTDHGWDRVIGLKNILKINRLLKKKGIIGESFIPEDYFQATVPHLGTEWRESYIDRMNIVYYLPKEYFQSHAEILIFREQVIVFHLRSEIAVEIRNEEILKMFKQLFDMLKLFARRVDTQNAG